MKKILFIPCLLLLAVASCNNADGPGDSAAVAESNTKTASNPSPQGYGTFTFTQDGKPRTFTAWHEFILFPMNDKTTILLLEDGGPSNAGFDFKINKAGTTEFKAGYANNIAPALLFSFFDTTGISYIGDGMTVNVTSLNETRLTGTFSGKFVKEKYQIKQGSSANVPQVIEVTDGKFNLHQ